ncbi:MAG TPA: MFS transporter [Nitriliruptorales bacterium]
MPDPTTWRTALAASGALASATLPLFLLGAFSVPIGRDLGIDESGIGAAVTVLFVASALAARAAGRLADRMDGTVTLRAAVAIAGLASAALGAFATSWWHIAGLFAVVGVAVALVDTGSARLFADRVPVARHGTAFGIKEASVPVASLLAGLGLPTVGARYGWRAVFVAALVVSGFTVLVLLKRTARGVSPHEPTSGRTPGGAPSDTPSSAPSGTPDGAPDGAPSGAPDGAPSGAPGGTPSSAPSGVPGHDSATTGRLRALAAAVALGSGAANASATFLVPAALDHGLSASSAGLVLAAASLVAASVRLGTGRAADHGRDTAARALTTLMGLGAAGATVLALGGPRLSVVVGALTVLGAGWGWTGLAFHVATRARSTQPASAAGVVLRGLGIGGAVGPLAFGTLAARVSYAVAWTAAAAAMAAGAVLATRTRTPAASPRTSA